MTSPDLLHHAPCAILVIIILGTFYCMWLRGFIGLLLEFPKALSLGLFYVTMMQFYWAKLCKIMNHTGIVIKAGIYLRTSSILSAWCIGNNNEWMYVLELNTHKTTIVFIIILLVWPQSLNTKKQLAKKT